MIAACIIAVQMSLGGDVETHVREMLAANAAECEVRIEGVCASACTLYLGADHVCVSPHARLMFHAPRMTKGPEEMKQFFSDYLSAWYPATIREWFRATVAGSGRDHWVTGAELIRHGVAPC